MLLKMFLFIFETIDKAHMEPLQADPTIPLACQCSFGMDLYCHT